MNYIKTAVCHRTQRVWARDRSLWKHFVAIDDKRCLTAISQSGDDARERMFPSVRRILLHFQRRRAETVDEYFALPVEVG